MAVSVTNLSPKYGMENWFCQRKWFLVTNPYFSKLSSVGIKYKVGWGLGCKYKKRWKEKHYILAKKACLQFTASSGHHSVFEQPLSEYNSRPQILFHDTLDMSLYRTWFKANAANQRPRLICQAESLSCATHVKSLSRHKICWFVTTAQKQNAIV